MNARIQVAAKLHFPGGSGSVAVEPAEGMTPGEYAADVWAKILRGEPIGCAQLSPGTGKPIVQLDVGTAVYAPIVWNANHVMSVEGVVL